MQHDQSKINEIIQNTHEAEIVSQSILEKRKRMRRILTEEFQDDILFKIYEERGWLERLFTDKILSMDVGVEYTSPEVADICETPHYNVNNKRKELVDYIQPKINETNRNWMHDYRSVFKIKMIDGLSGKDGVYTLKQLKAMIENKTGHSYKPEHHKDVSQNLQSLLGTDPEKLRFAIELVTSPKFIEAASLLVNENFLSQLQNIGTLHKALPSPDELNQLKQEIKEEIRKEASATLEQAVQQATNQFVAFEEKLQDIQNSRTVINEITNKCSELYQKISSPDLTFQQKEALLKEFEALKSEYPDYLDVIAIPYSAAMERISFLRQEQREFEIKSLRERAILLTEIVLDDSKSEVERESASKELERIFNEHKEISADLKLQIMQARRTKALLEEKQKGAELKGWRKLIARLIGIK
jgi:hypothetical protein